MSRALEHRGPTSEKIESTRWAAIGARGSSVAALADAPGRFAVVDGRIDNRKDLHQRVCADRPCDISEAELLLRCYLLWGERCARELIGDFAFAILDEPAGQLVLGRDPMGIKPLYYHRSSGSFAFASEIGALLALPEVPHTLDESQLAVQLIWGEPDRESTVYRAIRRLPAAHTLTLDRSGCQRDPVMYWSLEATQPLKRADPAEYVEEFREIFRTAVADRLHGVEHAATALSGGLDSSSITCLARDYARAGEETKISAVSLIFAGLSGNDRHLIDERQFVDAVVRGGGFDWLPIEGTELSPLGEVDNLLTRIGQPFAAPNVYLHDAMYRRASQAGATVFLDGVDGDTAISHGFGRLNGLLARREWDRFAEEVRAFARRDGRGETRVLGHYGLPYLADLAEQGRWMEWSRVALALTRRFRISRRDLVRRWAVEPVVQRIRGRTTGGANAAQRTDNVLRAEVLEELRRFTADEHVQRATFEAESHRKGLLQPAYQQTLEIADACAAGVGVEPRYPFFDQRLLEFCVALPDEEKLANGWSRWILRRAMEGILPPEVQWRTGKSNLAPAFQRSFTATDRDTVATAELGRLTAISRVDQIEALRQRYQEGEMDEWGDPATYLLFRSTVQSRWRKGIEAASESLRQEASEPEYTKDIQAATGEVQQRAASASAA